MAQVYTNPCNAKMPTAPYEGTFLGDTLCPAARLPSMPSSLAVG